MRLLLLFALLWALPSLVFAVPEPCQCDDVTFNAGLISNQGSWTSCTIDPADTFHVNSGCNVTFDQNFTQSDNATAYIKAFGTGAITILPEVVVTVAGGSDNPDTELGNVGFETSSTGTFVMGNTATSPGWRQFRTASPTLQSSPSFWVYGAFSPCKGDQACAADLELARSTWLVDQFELNHSSGSVEVVNYVEDSFAEIVGNDVMLFWEESVTDKVVSHDHLFFYEIDSCTVTPGVSAFCDYDLRQGEAAYTDFTLARRQLVHLTLSADSPIGDRLLEVVAGSFTATTAGQYNGWFVRCENDASTPVADPWNAYRVTTIRDGGANPDKIELSDVNGLRSACDSGDDIYLEPGGHVVGANMVVMAPARIVAASAGADSNVLLAGDVTVDAVVFSGMSRIEVREPTAQSWGFTWLKDLLCGDVATSVGDAGCIEFNDPPISDVIFPGVISITGGNNGVASNAAASFHGTTFRGPGHWNWRALSGRHHKDDLLIAVDRLAGTCAAGGEKGYADDCGKPDSVHVDLMRCQQHALNDDSMQCASTDNDGNNDTWATTIDVQECVTCNSTSTSVNFGNAAAQSSNLVGAALMLELDGRVSEVMPYEDLTMIGGGGTSGMFQFLNRFVIREYEGTEKILDTNNSVDWKNGYLYRVGFLNNVGIDIFLANSFSIMDNVAIVDPYHMTDTATCGGQTCTLFNFRVTTADDWTIDYKRVAWLLTNNFDAEWTTGRLRRWFSTGGTAVTGTPTKFEMDKLLMSGLIHSANIGTTVVYAMVSTDAEIAAIGSRLTVANKWCFSENTGDHGFTFAGSFLDGKAQAGWAGYGSPGRQAGRDSQATDCGPGPLAGVKDWQVYPGWNGTAPETYGELNATGRTRAVSVN